MKRTTDAGRPTESFISPAETPRPLMDMAGICALALHSQHTWDRLGPLLASDLNANPLVRRVAEFVQVFRRKYNKLPASADYEVWVGTLPEPQRLESRDSVQRIFARRLLGEPEHAVESLLAELDRHAAQLVQSRLALANGAGSLDVVSREVERMRKLLRGGGTPAEEWPTMRSLLERPDLLDEPTELVPRLAWRGRHVLIAGLAKLGKSTLVAQGAAAVSRAAPFLDGKAEHGRVVWCGIDEYLGDTLRRLQRFGARADRVRPLAVSPVDLLASLNRLLDHLDAEQGGGPVLVVIDSLIEWARRTANGGAPDDGDAAGWSEVVRPLTALAHDRSVAVLTIHHSRRSDGRFRSSGEIAAGVDAIYDMLGPAKGEDLSVRRLEGVGRWSIGRWRARMVEGRYEFGGELQQDVPRGEDGRLEGVEEKIRAALASGPITGKDALRRRVGVRNNDLYAALDAMERRGEVRVSKPTPGKAQVVSLAGAVADSSAGEDR